MLLKAQLVEKQSVQAENHRLKLQLESMEAQCRVEQRKAGEERSGTAHERRLHCPRQQQIHESKAGFCYTLGGL